MQDSLNVYSVGLKYSFFAMEPNQISVVWESSEPDFESTGVVNATCNSGAKRE